MAKNPENSAERFDWGKLIGPLGLLAIATLVSLGAYSEKQKTAIKERDQDSCQFPGEHNCGGKIIIHQIIPPKYAKKFNINPDFAENGLTICRNAQKLIYPDTSVETANIPEAIKTRNIKLNQRQPYWVTIFDRAMSAVAVRNTQQAQKDQAWYFPDKKTRNKKA